MVQNTFQSRLNLKHQVKSMQFLSLLGQTFLKRPYLVYFHACLSYRRAPVGFSLKFSKYEYIQKKRLKPRTDPKKHLNAGVYWGYGKAVILTHLTILPLNKTSAADCEH